MKKLTTIVLLMAAIATFAQRRVSEETMAKIYDEVRTPFKYGMVVAPTDNQHKIDCPTIFRQGNKWLMTYVVYNGKTGRDGRGYETWLSESDNLLEWRTLGRILSYRDGYWDCNQRGGFPGLLNIEWGGDYMPGTYKGKHWMTYIGGAGRGYEAVEQPLYVGLAWTDSDISKAHEWQSLDKPLLSIHDKDVQWWENLVQYKSTIYWDKSKTLGYPFVMYYNAGGINPETKFKGERIGIALSKDMKTWKRYAGNPVFTHEASGTITGDAQIQKIGDVYVMFYFSAYNPTRKYKAYNTFACSYDLVHWDDWQGDDLIIPSKDYDELFAHKSFVLKHNGIVYHFYCAVNNNDQRGIALAVSRPLGRSEVNFPKPDTKNRRNVVTLNEDWQTKLIEVVNGASVKQEKLERKADRIVDIKAAFSDSKDWQKVNIPHNWDDYAGYRQLTHGNLHGTAIYRKTFIAPEIGADKQIFLRFDGVGSYATVVLNGKAFDRFPSGRVTHTLDVTDVMLPGKENTLEVVAEHPEMIADMPWVCGGCSSEWGFSEGSAPLGIFRPVTLEVTDKVRIEPFGVHIWNDDKANGQQAKISLETEVKNYSDKAVEIELVNKLSNADGKQQFRVNKQITLAAGETQIIRQEGEVLNPQLWSCSNPYLYKLVTMIKRNGKTTDELSTSCGIRTVSWPVKRSGGNDGRFFLNGEPTFINGVCEYEHQFGQSHAFSDEQTASRIKQIEAAGFNAFRDAHQPHNLKYQEAWDKDGILWWPQFSAHIWYDTPEFRENFKALLRQWVKERRNSPSLVIWGLQNESTLPRGFAQECSDIIRDMDPTAKEMRIITTCNGGEGTDWNVIQNWSGTYGGNPQNYSHELAQKNQLLNGEYGAWRTLDLHTEPVGEFQQNGAWSEERMCQLLEMKIREAEQAKDSVCGQFQWIYSSHDNPGRRQPDEALRRVDKVGPFNYKGLVTPWEEPTDAYYMYKSNYMPASKEPMVYLCSHTWADRFSKSGRRRATIEAYSNCDSVLLYNDAVGQAVTVNKSTLLKKDITADAKLFLGRKKNNGLGTHFQWENRDVRYNVLRAVGYYQGKPAAEDILVLKDTEQAPHFDALYADAAPLLKGEQGYNYLYRINCGGDAYADEFGQTWEQDNERYSHSWAEEYKDLNPYQASQRTTYDPVRGVKDWALFQHFRFGRHKLDYRFYVPDGKYRVELYFIEPWHGTGGSEKTDCEGLRIFDVAVNGKTVIHDLDLWAEAGHDGAVKRVVDVDVSGGSLVIGFPQVKAGQAVISAIAIASRTVSNDQLPMTLQEFAPWSWEKAGQDTIAKLPKDLLPEDKNARIGVTYEAEQAQVKGKFVTKEVRKQKGVFLSKGARSIQWEISTGLAQVYALRFKFMNTTQQPRKVHLRFIDSKGVILMENYVTFPDTPEKWRMLSTTTGTFINAGVYTVELSGDGLDGLGFDALEVQ